MKYEYKKINYPEESINLCTDHAVLINERDNNELVDLVCRNIYVEEVPNCIVCDGTIGLDDLIKSLEWTYGNTVEAVQGIDESQRTGWNNITLHRCFWRRSEKRNGRKILWIAGIAD